MVSRRDRAIEFLEAADAANDPRIRRTPPHWVMVGANFSDFEVAREFEVFLRPAARRQPKLRPCDLQITSVEVPDRIPSALDPPLSSYAEAQLCRRRFENLRAIGDCPPHRRRPSVWIFSSRGNSSSRGGPGGR